LIAVALNVVRSVAWLGDYMRQEGLPVTKRQPAKRAGFAALVATG
jgi:hypothetical protein